MHLTDIPHSDPAYPENVLDRIKYWLWKIISPLHPYIRDMGIRIGIFRHSGRQPFLIGHLTTIEALPQMVQHAVQAGFGINRVAWKDSGELVSLRRTDGFVRQYHLRIFADGEVRGHYEFTPEAHPILHMLEIQMQARVHEFHAWLMELESIFVPVSAV